MVQQDECARWRFRCVEMPATKALPVPAAPYASTAVGSAAARRWRRKLLASPASPTDLGGKRSSKTSQQGGAQLRSHPVVGQRVVLIGRRFQPLLGKRGRQAQLSENGADCGAARPSAARRDSSPPRPKPPPRLAGRRKHLPTVIQPLVRATTHRHAGERKPDAAA